MTRKEIAEIRKRFNPERNNVTVIRGCYVNQDGEIISEFAASPLAMPEEEAIGETPWRIAGEVFHTYIICEDGSEKEHSYCA